MDKMRLNGEIEVLVNNVKFKIKEVDHLTQQIRQLNMSCMSKVREKKTARGNSLITHPVVCNYLLTFGLKYCHFVCNV